MYFSYIISVSTLYSSRDFFMFSLFLLHCFYKDTFIFFHSFQVYIAVDTILYPYTLPIDHSLLFYPKLLPKLQLNPSLEL